MSTQGFGTSGGAPGAPPVPPPVPANVQRRGGIGLGVVLIAVGVVFLIGQFVPNVAWWHMWPLIVILVGGIQIVTPDPKDGWGLSRIMDGIGTIVVGAVLLGNTTGFVSWDVWLTLLMLWPVLLVAIGLRIIGKGVGQSWVGALGPVLVWIAFAYAVSTALTGAGGLSPFGTPALTAGKHFALFEPVGQVTEAKMSFEGGAGDIKIGSNSGQLVSASGTSPFGEPKLEVKREGSSADVKLGLGEGGLFVAHPGAAAGKTRVELSDQVVWDAELETGASNLDADFSQLKLRALKVSAGASRVNVELGVVPDEVTNATVAVEAGVSSVTIVVPRDAEARVVSSGGLSSTDVSGELTKKGDGSWQTPGYASAARVYDISIESGVGSVSIERN
jgi:hypothetical protein